MKSRTSFCKRAIVKKDITRFAPIWVLYTIWALLVILSSMRSGGGASNVKSLGSFINIFAVVDLVYAFVNAELLFGDLFNARLCNALHAMPVNRTHQFRSHVTAGMLFALLPNLAATIAMMCKLGTLWYTALLWLLGTTLAYVYFFGLAALCMMLTGNRFACMAVYTIINFFAYVVWWLIHSVLLPLMPGVVLGSGDFSWFCPVVLMASADLFDYKYTYVNGRQVVSGVGLQSGWITLAIFGLVGVGLLLLALALYRRRALEKAGDFLALKVLEPVFLVLYTLCAGAFLALCAIEDELMPVFLAIGILIGYFTGRMLLERTVRVLHKRAFKGLAVLVLVLGTVLGLAKLDVLGIVRYVPDVDALESVDISVYTPDIHYGVNLTDADALALVKNLHQDAIQGSSDGSYDEHVSLYLVYHLKNGKTVSRNYTLRDEAVYRDAQQLALRKEVIFGFSDPKEAVRDIQYFYVDKTYSDLSATMRTPENKLGLLEALEADWQEGHINYETDKEEAVYLVRYNLPNQTIVNSTEVNEDLILYSEDRILYIGKEATHTIAWLDAYFDDLDR